MESMGGYCLVADNSKPATVVGKHFGIVMDHRSKAAVLPGLSASEITKTTTTENAAEKKRSKCRMRAVSIR